MISSEDRHACHHERNWNTFHDFGKTIVVHRVLTISRYLSLTIKIKTDSGHTDIYR